MSATTFEKLSEIVQEICTQVGDKHLIKYADSTSYEGRAMNLFLQSVRKVLKNPKGYKMTEHDYRGMVPTEEVKIGGASDENGQIAFSSLSKNPKEILGVFLNSDSDNEQLPYAPVKINEEWPQFHEKVESSRDAFYCPQVDTDTQRGWFFNQSIIQFYPISGTGEQEYYVSVKYIAETNPDSYDKDTVIYIGGTDGLFSLDFIDICIDMAVAKILGEREI